MSTNQTDERAFQDEDDLEPPVTIPPTPEEYNTFAHGDDEEYEEMDATNEGLAKSSVE